MGVDALSSVSQKESYTSKYTSGHQVVCKNYSARFTAYEQLLLPFTSFSQFFISFWWVNIWTLTFLVTMLP